MADLKFLAKPTGFADDRAAFPDWAFAFVNYMSVVEFEFCEELEAAVIEKDPIRLHTDEEVRRLGMLV